MAGKQTEKDPSLILSAAF